MQRKGSSFLLNAPRKPQNPQMYTKGTCLTFYILMQFLEKWLVNDWQSI